MYTIVHTIHPNLSSSSSFHQKTQTQEQHPDKGIAFFLRPLTFILFSSFYIIRINKGEDYFIVLGIRAPGHRSENVLILQHRIWAWDQPRERLKKTLNRNYGFRNCRGILSYDLRNRRGNELSVTTAEASDTAQELSYTTSGNAD
jgi:hypothetical protein